MNTYRYEAMDCCGTERKDFIAAPDVTKAETLVRKMGLFITKIDMVLDDFEEKEEKEKEEEETIETDALREWLVPMLVASFFFGLVFGIIITVAVL